MCLYVCLCCIPVYLCVCTFAYQYTCVSVRLHIGIPVCLYVLHIGISVCLCPYICVSVCTSVCLCLDICVYGCMCMLCLSACARPYACVSVLSLCLCIHMSVFVCQFVCVCVCVYAYVSVCMHIHLLLHTNHDCVTFFVTLVCYLQVYTSNGPSVVMPTWFCHRGVVDRAGMFDESGKVTYFLIYQYDVSLEIYVHPLFFPLTKIRITHGE